MLLAFYWMQCGVKDALIVSLFSPEVVLILHGFIYHLATHVILIKTTSPINHTLNRTLSSRQTSDSDMHTCKSITRKALHGSRNQKRPYDIAQTRKTLHRME